MIIGYLSSGEQTYISRIKINWLKYMYGRAIDYLPFLRHKVARPLPLGEIEFRTRYSLVIGIHQATLEQADALAGIVESHLNQRYTKKGIFTSSRLKTTKKDSLKYNQRTWTFEREDYFAGLLEGKGRGAYVRYYKREPGECDPDMCNPRGCTSVEIELNTVDGKANSRLLEQLVNEQGIEVADKLKEKYEKIIASKYDLVENHIVRGSLQSHMKDIFSLNFPNRVQPYRGD